MKQFQIFLILGVLGLFAACSTTPNAPDHTFNNTDIGFSITKPSEWHYVSRKILEENRDANRANNAELEEVSQKTGDSPFLTVFSRYPEPNSRNNPTVSVTVLNTGVAGLPPKSFLGQSTVILKKAYPDLTIVEEVRDREVDGIIGAFTRLKFTIVGADDQRLPTMHRIWLVPRGVLMFSIAMTGPQEGPDVSEDAFQEILKSIKITR